MPRSYNVGKGAVEELTSISLRASGFSKGVKKRSLVSSPDGMWFSNSLFADPV
jgi:hypothetical protein